MRRPFLDTVLAVLVAVWGSSVFASEEPVVKALYKQHCAQCHGEDRLGGTGPALIPDNLQRLRKSEASVVIAQGRPSTQMPAFGVVLKPAEVTALAELIYAPLPAMPPWSLERIQGSHVVHNAMASLPEKPVYDADPLNLFTVVEAGDHHVTILDGDTFEPLWRFPSRFALHGGAKYSPDGRFVFLGSRDGWVSTYDLWGLKPIAEVRTGINLRNIAVSADGRWVMVANVLPHTLVVLNAADLSPVKVISVEDGEGRSSRVSAVYTASPRNSFIAALKDIPEIWEMSYEAHPKPVPKGFVHNYQPGMMEGEFDHGPFPVRRIRLDDYLDDFFFDPSYRNVIGAARDTGKAQVVNLNVGRAIADLPLSGMPHLGSGIVFDHQNRPVLATPHLNEAAISVIDMTSWQLIRRIPTLGPGFFLRSHENTPYAWVDASFSARRDCVQVVDKRALEVVKTLCPRPGKTASHVEFTRDGRFLLLSIAEMDGEIIVLDAASFQEVKSIPMRKPSGKYNVYNKITLSTGTSH